MDGFLSAFLINDEKIKSLWGSEDYDLFNLVVRDSGPGLENISDIIHEKHPRAVLAEPGLQDFFRADLTSIKESLEDSSNEATIDEINSLYGYLYLILCDYFGERVILSPAEKGNKRFVLKNQNLRSFISKKHIGLPIPHTEKMRPHILEISHIDLDSYLEIFVKSEYLNKIDADESNQIKKAFKTAFEEAKLRGLNLIFFECLDRIIYV